MCQLIITIFTLCYVLGKILTLANQNYVDYFWMGTLDWKRTAVQHIFQQGQQMKRERMKAEKQEVTEQEH
jgi:hypothetical protein